MSGAAVLQKVNCFQNSIWQSWSLLLNFYDPGGEGDFTKAKDCETLKTSA